MIKIGVIGGAGYTAGELLRILSNHPKVSLQWVHSNSHSGQPFYAVHKDLIGESEGIFCSEVSFDVDLIFICSGHGKTKEFMNSQPIPSTVKIIDLSHDYRLKAEGNDFIYGLPEMNEQDISAAIHVANPGCFATAIQLGLLPLAANNVLQEDIHVHAITGSTGAGQQPGQTTHYSWRNNNISIYKAFDHQHLGEINQSIHQLQVNYLGNVKFLPIRGNFTKGIFASLYTTIDATETELSHWYKDYYAHAPFVHVTSESPDLKQVINTNKCLIHIEKHGDTVLITSVIDNMIKGAAGQAVQNMNLMFGLNQKDGLKLKSSGF